jgi:hypothetical protein
MRRAKPKIAPNLVSAARSSNEDVVATTSNFEVSRDNQATDSVIEPGPSFPRYKSNKRIQPISNAYCRKI